MFASAEIPGRAISPIALTLVDEINHRVINEYSEAIASLSIAASRTPEQDAKAALRRAADRLRDHAASHRALSPPVGGERANLADYIGEICIALTKAMLEERGVHLELKTVDAIIPGERCWQIGLIVAELIRNAARLAWAGWADLGAYHRMLRQSDMSRCRYWACVCDCVAGPGATSRSRPCGRPWRKRAMVFQVRWQLRASPVPEARCCAGRRPGQNWGSS
jgi:hypothetical protein